VFDAAARADMLAFLVASAAGVMLPATPMMRISAVASSNMAVPLRPNSRWNCSYSCLVDWRSIGTVVGGRRSIW